MNIKNCTIEESVDKKHVFITGDERFNNDKNNDYNLYLVRRCRADNLLIKETQSNKEKKYFPIICVKTSEFVYG